MTFNEFVVAYPNASSEDLSRNHAAGLPICMERVVRCADCKSWRHAHTAYRCEVFGVETDSRFFCAYGDRRQTGRRIAVTGGRDFDRELLVRFVFDANDVNPSDVIVHGGCRGADMLCEKVATEMLVRSEVHKADWNKHGKAAGPIRNREMLMSGIDLLIAFPGGRGTSNCVSIAKELGIVVKDYRKLK